MTEIVERLRLPPDPTSAGAARRFIANALDTGDEVAELAVLLVSELASNAILHAATPFEIILHAGDEQLRVELVDGNPALPTMRPYAPESVNGRGLHIVAATADRWGFEPRGGGKLVWFELDR